MIIIADFEYKLEEKLANHRNTEFVRTKLLEFVDGFVMQGVLGALNDMDIPEKKFSRDYEDVNHLKITVDTFGVELLEDETDEVDSPFVNDDLELWLLEPLMSVKFLDTE